MKKNTQMELRRHHGPMQLDGVRSKTSPSLVDDRRSEDGEGRGGAKYNIRRVWGLPRTAHNNLLPLISCQPPLSDVIAELRRFISYVQRCLTSDCDIVNYVVQ